jgi:integrase
MIERRKRKDGSLSFRVQVRDYSGKYFPTKTFSSRKEAERWERELMNQRDRGAVHRQQPLLKSTMAEYWLRWAADCRGQVSVGWRGSQEQMWRDHCAPYIGPIRLIEFEKADAALFMTKLQNKGLGEQTRLHIFNLLHKMFDDANEIFDVRETNPFIKKLKPRVAETERNFWSPVQTRAFLHSDTVQKHRLRRAFWIMLYAGLRTGEMQALRRKNLFLETGDIVLTEQWVRKEKRFGPMKNDKSHRIPMPQALVDFLEADLDPSMDAETFVVSNQNGSMLSHSVLGKGLSAAIKAAAEELKDTGKIPTGLPKITPHELRHSCTQIWEEEGGTTRDMQNLLNHSNEKSTRRYMHKADQRLKELSNRLRRRTELKVVK